MKFSRRAALLWLVLAGTGALLGILVGASGVLPGTRGRTTVVPLPHLVPARPGGLAFHFAMVDDVIHEQYLRHGKAYYEDRNRRMKEVLATPDIPKARRFEAMDDLGVGLDFLGEHNAAIALLRQKLAEHDPEGLERERYTTYANLGTFLIHGSFRAALDGDAPARAQLQEGLNFIYRAIEANPGAHFGRERWQAITVEFLLSAMKDPSLLLRYDLVGNRLDASPEVWGPLSIPRRIYAGRPAQAVSKYLRDAGRPELARRRRDGAGETRLREPIARVGVEGSWNEDAYTSLNESPPFDEPALGIIGMWRLGGGANPHFALALAGLMERVDQPLLAWGCYARAAELAERFWPDSVIQAGLLEHCHYRQLNLAARIGRPMESLRADFAARLAGGKARMQAYEEEEARRIAGGNFKESLPFDMEQATRANGERSRAFQDAIDVPLEELSPLAPARLVSLLPHGILGAGVFVFLASLVRDWRPVRKPARA